MVTDPGDARPVTLEEQTRRLYHAKRLFAVLSAVNRVITLKPGRRELIQAICRILVEVGEFRMAWFGVPDAEGWIVPEATFGDSQGYLDSIRISVHDIPQGGGPSGTAIREKRPLICNNIQANLKMRPWCEPAAWHGMNSSACFPVCLPSGVIAGLTLYSAETDFFSSDAEKLLVNIAGDIGYALEFIAAEEQRVVAEEALRERVRLQEQLEHIARTVPGVISSFRMCPDGTFSVPYASNGFHTLYGLSSGQVKEDASPLLERINRDDMEQNREGIVLSARDLTPWRCEFRYLHPTKGVIWLDWHSIPQREVDGGCLWHGYAHDITERKRTEESLRAEEKKFRTLVSATSQIIWVTDSKGRATEPVPSWETFTGLSYEETQGFGWLRALHRDDVDRTGWAMNHAQQMKSAYEVEHRILRHDGVYRDMQTRAVPVIADDGRVSQWIGVCADITERKRAREARAWLAALVESTDDAIITKDLSGNIQSWNAGAQRLFGYGVEEISGSPITILIPPELRHEEDHIQHRLSTGQPIDHFETVRVAKDGRRINVSLTVSPIKDSQGMIVGASKIIRDITERKQIMEELKDSEQRFQDVVIASADWVWEIDVEGRYTYASRSVEHILGYTVEEILGKSPFDLISDPEEAQRIRREYREIAKRQAPFRNLANPCRHKDGTIRHLLTNGIPILDHQGCLNGYRGMDRDVTDLKLVEEELARAKAEAEAANLSKSDFLANMSHEIRTPMNAVMGMAQLLEKELLSPDQSDMVQQIRTAGRSLLGILNDILDYSKIEAGQLRIELRPFHLSPLLEQLDSLFRGMACSKGLLLRFEATDDVTEILIGDSLRLEQILINLISNAIKFSQQGEVRLLIRSMEVTESSTQLRFQISDTGVGIAPDAVALLFQPFSQADSSISRRFGGTGLGLSICRRLVELMGGSIGVESREGVGSTFWFELPFGRTSVDKSLSLPLPRDVPVVGPRLSGFHILVVDDNGINRQLLARALTREGAQVTMADNGLQAVTQLREGGIDAVLMDIQMPVMDGLTATRAIRRDLGLTELPVIAVSAGVLPEERQNALDAGVNGFLPKPVDLEEMVALLLCGSTVSPGEVAPNSTKAGASQKLVSGIPRIPGIDADRVAVMFGDDGAFFLELLELFISRFGDAAEQIRADLLRGDRAAAAWRLHTLRGTAGNLGALELTWSAQLLEQAIVDGRVDPAPALEQFTTELAALIEAGTPLLRNSAPLSSAQTPPLDQERLAALRRALCFNDLASLELFNELEPALVGVYGEEKSRIMAHAMKRLRFLEVLKLLGEAGEANGIS